MLRTIYKTNNGFEDIQQFIANHEKNMEQKVFQVGHDTLAEIKEQVSINKVRPQAGEPETLEEALTIEFFTGFEIGWGIGEIAHLNQQAPYWAAVNYGSDHLVGKHLPVGTFSPGLAMPDSGSFRDGRWKQGLNQGGSTYSPIVTKPIPATNYIEKTVSFLRKKFSSFRLKLGR